MFRRKRGRSIEVTKLSSLVSHTMAVEGDVTFSGGLRVDGHIKGNVIGTEDGHGLLVLSDKGSIAGGVKVYDAVINGHIQGDVEVEHFLELQANACVSGSISYRQLQMDCGATVDGKLVCIEGEADETAKPGSKVVAIPASAASTRREPPPASSSAVTRNQHPGPSAWQKE